MSDEYEDLAVECTLLPGVDLRLWLAIISLLLASITAAGVVLTVR